jgi:hypothetical protein
MIDRVSALCLAGSVLLAAALPLEFRSQLSSTTEPDKLPAKTDEKASVQNDQPAISQLTASIFARPLFNPTRRPAEAASADHPETSLSDMRLTGILITSDQHLAIFAPAGGKLLVRSEGEMISDWRIESIATESIVLTGPTGTTTLEPKADTNLVRGQTGQPAAAPPQTQPAAAVNPQPAPATNAAARPPIPIRRSNR